MTGNRGNGNGHWAAVPAVHYGADGWHGSAFFTVDVDGEQFAVCQAAEGGSGYEWLSRTRATGSRLAVHLVARRRSTMESIRSFLRMIDPATGDISDE